MQWRTLAILYYLLSLLLTGVLFALLRSSALAGFNLIFASLISSWPSSMHETVACSALRMFLISGCLARHSEPDFCTLSEVW